MSFFSSRSEKTVTRSSGPGGSHVTQTTTTYGPDGQRTETTHHGGGGGGFGGFSKPEVGFRSDFLPSDVNINTRVGNIKINEQRKPVNDGHRAPSAAKPLQSRYSSGWGQKGSVRKPVGRPMKLDGKSYAEIKAQCLREGRLFEDPDFPAVDVSIFYSGPTPRPFVWKRPPEICSAPEFFTGGASRFDVKQGELGDCWLLAAVAGLCGHDDLFYRVVPKDNSFSEGYAGIFHFQFWQYGQWQDVIVDDRLPTYYDKLVFMHSVEMNEFWSPLLEKAYAKLVGSYEALKGGATSEAMEDFTGGVTEMYDLRQNAPPNLFQIMRKAHERSSLMGCSIDAKPGQLEAELANGLIMGHAYTITSVTTVDIQTSRVKGEIPMVRVRNPWGNECEWKGAWSDKSPEWKFISEGERKEIGLTFNDDGEFWMSFQDFSNNFQKVEICNLGPDALTDEALGSGKKRWESNTQDGAWKRRVNAGGCRNYLDTFWTNPQYRVDVVDPDDDDDDNMGTLLVALMQKSRRKLRKEGVDLLTMGYSIYKLKDEDTGPLDMRFFKYNASVAKSPAFINLREVCGRHKLPPGQYCVLPSTYEPNQEGDFLLRIFSEKPAASGEMDEETGMSDVQKPKTKKKPPQEMTEDDARQDNDMKHAFKRVAGEDMEIDAYELRQILNAAFMKEFKFDGFSNETCRSMVATLDDDRSGRLGFEEFRKLWIDLRLWKTVFKNHDKDKSGNFNSYELRQAFHAIGFRVSNQTFNALVQRYSQRDGKIEFDDFIHCVVRMKTMFDIFKEMDRGGKPGGKAEFSLDQFIQTTMYS